MLQELLMSNDLNVRVMSSMCQGWVNNEYNIQRGGNRPAYSDFWGLLLVWHAPSHNLRQNELGKIQILTSVISLCVLLKQLYYWWVLVVCLSSKLLLIFVFSSLLLISSDHHRVEVVGHPETCCPPHNAGVMTERNTAPSFPNSDEPYLCAALTAGEKQSSKTTGSPGHRPEPNCPTRHAIPPLFRRRFGSAETGSNMIPDNEPPEAGASSRNRCKDSSSWQLTVAAFTGSGIKQMM